MNQQSFINMLKQQLRTGNVLDDKILELFENIPRHDFVPEDFKEFAYSDMQIPLPNKQRMLTPLEEGLILDNLKISKHETVLEIGTGCGFLTALLSQLAHKVISVEYYKELSEIAQKNLSKYQCDNVELVVGDGLEGCLEKAPFDAMVMSAGIAQVTPTHKLQLLSQGKLFAIVGKKPSMQGQLHKQDVEGNWSKKIIFNTCVPEVVDNFNKKTFIF